MQQARVEVVWTSFMVDRRRGGLGSSALRQALPYQFPSRSSCIGLCACFVARPHQSTQSKHHLSLLHTCKNAQAAAQTTKSLLSGITINAINCPNFGPGSRSSPVPLEPSPASLPPPFVNRLGLATRMLESPHQGPSHPASEPWMTHVRLTILARRSRGRCHQVCAIGAPVL